jgi:hypothetical protein
MSWASRQRRALNRTEKTLLADDLRLGSLSAVFTRLTREDVMPPAEQVEAGPGHLLRAAVAYTRRRRRPGDRAPAAGSASWKALTGRGSGAWPWCWALCMRWKVEELAAAGPGP